MALVPIGGKSVPSSRDMIAREKIRRKKIYIYGAPCNASTGNSKLIYYMAKVFQGAGHEVMTVGVEYNNHQIKYDDIPILPGFHCDFCGNQTKGKNIGKLAYFINSHLPMPDYFICVGDPYLFQQYGAGNLDFGDSITKKIMYATLDSFGVFCNEMEIKKGNRDYVAQCDKVISTSRFTADQFKEWLDIKTPVIHEIIDLKNFCPVSPEKKKSLREKYRFKENDFIMYYGGRNIMRKRHNTLFDACAKFLCETENTYLYINIPESKDPNKNVLWPDVLNPVDFISRVLKKKYGRDLLAEKRIIFVDRGDLGDYEIGEPEMAELYQLSDAYVTACANEGFGLMPVEALACGIPAICPEGSTGPEIIGADADFVPYQHSENSKGFSFAKGGLLTHCPFDLWEVNGLRQRLVTSENTYNAIKFLYEDPLLRERFGKEGREYVEKMFNLELFKKKWLDIISTTEKKQGGKFKTLEFGGKDNGKENPS